MNDALLSHLGDQFPAINGVIRPRFLITAAGPLAQEAWQDSDRLLGSWIYLLPERIYKATMVLIFARAIGRYLHYPTNLHPS